MRVPTIQANSKDSINKTKEEKFKINFSSLIIKFYSLGVC